MTPDIFSQIEQSDRRLYYNGTFLRIRPATQLAFRWVHIDDFINKDSSNVVTFRGEEGNPKLLDTRKIEWDFTIPQSGAYNYKNTVVLFFRMPLRQTTKGLARSNTIFMNLMRDVMKAGAIPQTFYAAHDFLLSPKSLNLLFEDMEPLSFEKGLSKIARKQALAFAVNNRISISQGIFSRHPSIWLKNRIIGELDLSKEVIYPLHTAFVPELLSTFVDKGLIIKQN
jgi:hypothetical protein